VLIALKCQKYTYIVFYNTFTNNSKQSNYMCSYNIKYYMVHQQKPGRVNIYLYF